MPGANPGAGGRSPLHWIWICDVSDSMNLDGKIATLNEAIQGGLAELVKFSEEKDINILVHTLKFSSGAEWMEKDFIPVKDYQWKNLKADGLTDLGEALSKIADVMMPGDEGGMMSDRCKLPHMILITDGYPTDDWESGLKRLIATSSGKNAVRMAVALPGADLDVLKEFVGNVPEAEERLVDLSEDQSPTRLTACIINMSRIVCHP